MFQFVEHGLGGLELGCGELGDVSDWHGADGGDGHAAASGFSHLCPPCQVQIRRVTGRSELIPFSRWDCVGD